MQNQPLLAMQLGEDQDGHVFCSQQQTQDRAPKAEMDKT